LPARAPSSSSLPKVSRYAFCTYDRATRENPSVWWILGRAVMTIEISSTIIVYSTFVISGGGEG
jgi:hypothetical protein